VVCGVSRWEKFSAAVSAAGKRGQAGVVAELFPFSEYFADAPQLLFKPGASYEDDMEVRGKGGVLFVSIWDEAGGSPGGGGGGLRRGGRVGRVCVCVCVCVCGGCFV